MSSSESTANVPSPLPEEAFLPPRRKRSRLVFWLLAVAAVAGGSCVVGCLILAAMSDARRVTAPADVLAVAHEIVPVTIPDGYVGELGEVVKMPFFTVRKAVFRHDSGKGVLSIVELKFPSSLPDQDPQVRQAAFDSVVTDMRQIVPAEESKRTVTIHQQPAEFQLRAGRDALSSTQLHEVRGVFHGANGLAQLWLQAEDSIWDQEPVDRMLDSLSK